MCINKNINQLCAHRNCWRSIDTILWQFWVLFAVCAFAGLFRCTAWNCFKENISLGLSVVICLGRDGSVICGRCISLTVGETRLHCRLNIRIFFWTMKSCSVIGGYQVSESLMLEAVVSSETSTPICQIHMVYETRKRYANVYTAVKTETL
jgi:hypothetical protein